jgi:hypothetical protein
LSRSPPEQRRVEDRRPGLLGQIDPRQLRRRTLRRVRAGLREVVRDDDARPHLAPNTVDARDHRPIRQRGRALDDVRIRARCRASWLISAAIASCENIVIPRRDATSRRKWFVSAGMSSPLAHRRQLDVHDAQPEIRVRGTCPVTSSRRSRFVAASTRTRACDRRRRA